MPNEEAQIVSRKSDHIRINLEENVNSGISTGLEKYKFVHNALPELDLKKINTHLGLFKKNLNAPLLISSMTGGSEMAETINQKLAMAAQTCGIAMGLGSQRAALENKALERTFQMRKFAPNILLFANVGAVQLNYVTKYEDFCRRAVDMIEADALYLHLNPLQEALQPEGDVNFEGLVKKIEKIVLVLPVPVVIKEVGWGISAKTAHLLNDVGVAGIDVAGAGGTSWSEVEKRRINNAEMIRIAGLFRDWGIPTADAIIQARQFAPKCKIFASGGVRNGLEAAKCIALGADLVGSAAPFLKAAAVSVEETITAINEMITALRITMFVAGAKDIQSLQKIKMEFQGRE